MRHYRPWLQKMGAAEGRQLDRVAAVRTNTQGDEAVLRDGSLIPVSRRKRGLLVELLRQA